MFNKMRVIISSFMTIVAVIMTVIIVFSVGALSYTKSEYESLLTESTNKYRSVSTMESSATSIKYRKQLGYDIGYEQLKLIMLIKDYIATYEESQTEDVKLMIDLIATFKESGMDSTTIITTLQDMDDIVSTSLEEKDKELSSSMTKLIIFVMIAVVLILCIVGFICYFFPKRLADPIIKISDYAKKIGKGQLDNLDIPETNISELKDLTDSFQSLTASVSNIIEEVDDVCVEFLKGNNKTIPLENSNLEGGFREVAEKINTLISNTSSMFDEILSAVGEYAKGNFDYEPRQFEGEHAIINAELSECQQNFKNVIIDINSLIQSVGDGELNNFIEVEGKTGDWLTIVNGLNNLVKSVSEPINETIKGLNKLAKADLGYRINKEFKGSYKEIADTINYVAQTLGLYVSDINAVLRSLANHDLTVSSSIDYAGDFSEIGESIQNVTLNFKNLVGSMVAASEQIQAGSKGMADSSTGLALGATQQADAVRILLDLSETVSKKSSENFTAATNAKEYSDSVTSDIQNGNQLLTELNTAITNIASASNAINNINAVIDDIAFQTNLLALNAAIEAVRAGAHGKGFAVVADEVRNLAGKSKASARDAGNLIQETLTRVEEGVVVVNNTISLLTNILSETTKIDTIINDVLSISGEQKELSERMQVETSKINEVVNNISATSEETAATSEELASQIETFNENIALFKL